MLSQSESRQGAYNSLSLMLRRVIQLKMCVSLKKFVVNTLIKYGGFMLKATYQGKVNFMRDESRIDDLLNSPPPTSKAELQSFLGLLNTLNVWSPHYEAQTTI